MDELLAVAAEFFDRDGWAFSHDEHRFLLELPVRTSNGSWTCLAQSFEADRRFVFYSLSPVPAPESMLEAFAEFLTRANYGLVLGNFEMDWSDGEIRFKTSIDVGEGRLTSTLLAHLAYPNVRIMGRYLPGIIALIEQGLTAKQAVSLVEDEQTGNIVGDLATGQN